MSGRLRCYKQQQHSKLLTQFVFKVSAFCFNTRTKTHAPLPDCRINNALIQFIPSCHHHWNFRKVQMACTTHVSRHLRVMHTGPVQCSFAIFV